MVILFTEGYEYASEVNSFLVDTDQLPLDFKRLIENSLDSGFAGAPSNSDWQDALEQATIDFPFTGTVQDSIIFYWD